MLLRNVISSLKPKQHSSVACCAECHMGIFLGEACVRGCSEEERLNHIISVKRAYSQT